jgi:hypothetical protein
VEGLALGDITGPDHQRVTDVYPPHHDDADYITHACNAYPKLVAILKKLNAGEYFESLVETSRSPGRPDPDAKRGARSKCFCKSSERNLRYSWVISPSRKIGRARSSWAFQVSCAVRNSTCADRRLPCPTQNGQSSAKRTRDSRVISRRNWQLRCSKKMKKN